MSIREEFEKWECEADQGPQTDPMWLMYDSATNTYPLDKIQSRWECWQASREALVIDLPKPESEEGESWDGCWKYAVKQCREAIEATGVKVKA